MKPSSLADLKNKAVTQAIDTIRNRVDALGVSEPTIEQHGLGGNIRFWCSCPAWTIPGG